MRTYKDALEIQERFIANIEANKKAIETLPLLLDAIEPERRFKSWNKVNTDRVNKALEASGCICKYVTFSEKPYGLAGWRFGFYYDYVVDVVEHFMFKPSQTTARHKTDWLHADCETKEGEHVYQAVKREIDRVTAYYNREYASLGELERFFNKLETLRTDFPNFERAIKLLTDRNIE